MIRVGMLTTWGDRCGTSEHARHVLDHAVASDILIKPIQKTIGEFSAHPPREPFDIVHVNESGWILQGLEPDSIQKIKKTGSKTLLTMNASCPQNNRNPWTTQFDGVVVFEPHTTDGFYYVPIGAPVFDSPEMEKSNRIGTNGFPQERKNLLALAEACQELGLKLVAFIPESQHANASEVANKIRERNPEALVRTDWVSDTEMLLGLSSCVATCYPYLEWYQGASSAAMAGVSARVPIVVSRASQFDFLFSREDEVYFIESSRPTKNDIRAGIRNCLEDFGRKVPKKLYEEHRWDRAGQRYVQVYRDLVKR